MTRIDAVAWLTTARARLAPVSERPLSEAQLLLGHVLNLPRQSILAHPELPLSADQLESLNGLLERLAAGTPLPYLTGRQEFFGLNLSVSPDVLIPRPETEQLVELALRWLRANPDRRLAADAGTGSGCIAAALAYHCLDIQVIATDLSRPALRIARRNLMDYHLEERVRLLQANLLTPLAGGLDLICANLPYIPTATVDGLAVTAYEPRSALDGGPAGLDWIAALLADAARLLAPGGLMLLEIEAGQGDTVPALARRLIPGAEINLLFDLAGLPRLVMVNAPR